MEAENRRPFYPEVEHRAAALLADPCNRNCVGRSWNVKEENRGESICCAQHQRRSYPPRTPPLITKTRMFVGSLYCLYRLLRLRACFSTPCFFLALFCISAGKKETTLEWRERTAERRKERKKEATSTWCLGAGSKFWPTGSDQARGGLQPELHIG